MTRSVPAAHHAAVSAGVRGGDTVVCSVGDGAVGLCAVQEARRRGAAQVVVVGHHDDRLDVAKQCGADETVNAAENPAEAIEDVMGRTGGAQRVLEMRRDGLVLADRRRCHPGRRSDRLRRHAIPRGGAWASAESSSATSGSPVAWHRPAPRSPRCSRGLRRADRPAP